MGILNVLTRTCNRPRAFKRCRNSVDEQTYPNIRHIVGYDKDSDSPYARVYHPLERNAHTEWEHNRFLNQLAEHVESGWIMYLDDDDEFVDKDSAELIMKAAAHFGEDSVLFWIVDINGVQIPRPGTWPSDDFTRGNISGIGFAFHVKHLQYVKWDAVPCGDYFVIQELTINAPVDVRWIGRVLTRTQGAPGGGRRQDILTVAERSGEDPPS